MKKLTAEEILKIVKDNYSEESFAFEEWSKIELELPEDLGKEEDRLRDLYFQENFSEIPRSEWEDDKVEVYYNMPSKFSVMKAYILNHLGLGKVVEVAQYGGEGQGDDWWSVKHFVDHDVYIKIEGDYTSYHGTEFYGGYGYEVKPVEKVVTVFEKVNN
jgi:hypothetical protein